MVMAFRGCSSLREENEEGGDGVSWVLLPKSLRGVSLYRVGCGRMRWWRLERPRWQGRVGVGR